MKKLLTLAMVAMLAVGCSAPTNTTAPTNTATTVNEIKASDSSTTNTPTPSVNESKAPDANKMYTIGLAQFAEHGSLDNCRNGFIQGLADEGFVEGENLTIDYKNAQSDTAVANQIASNLAGTKPDMLCGIATPMVQALFNAANGKLPVVYVAVTDPVFAKLAKEDGTSSGLVTGVSDKLAIDAQLQMIRELMPNAKNIGIMYSTSEVNSISAVTEYKEKAAGYGFEIIDSGISQSSEIPLALDNLLQKVDCISNLTDNTVVTALPTMLDKANAKNIPVFGSEIEQVKKGCAASMGIEYIALGKRAGQMAGKVLKGEDISQMKFETITDSELYINSGVLNKLGLKLPENTTAIDVAEG